MRQTAIITNITTLQQYKTSQERGNQLSLLHRRWRIPHRQ